MAGPKDTTGYDRPCIEPPRAADELVVEVEVLSLAVVVAGAGCLADDSAHTAIMGSGHRDVSELTFADDIYNGLLPGYGGTRAGPVPVSLAAGQDPVERVSVVLGET